MNEGRAVISFAVEQGSENFIERMHAVPMGEDLYCLDNSPFYAYGVSYGDVVFAPQKDGAAVYERTAIRRGHSTYRVKLNAGDSHEVFLSHWDNFKKLGCTYEGSSANSTRLYSIDVPPHADIHAVYAILEANEANGTWVFEEGNYCSRDDRDAPEH